jgi:transcription elongation GreA/GreB family factor
MRKEVGDEVLVKRPRGDAVYEVLAVEYEGAEGAGD